MHSPVVPPQHGAWAFLLFPVALGVVAGGWTWAALPAVLGWVALYPFSWALTNRIAAPRPERFNRPLRIWSSVAAPLVAGSVVLHPWLVWVGLGYAIPFAANVAYARARRERDLANDLILVGECALAVAVVAGLAEGVGSWSPPWNAFTTSEVGLLMLVCCLVLVGSTLHVKSLIRERNNTAFTTTSRLFAAGCIPVVLIAADIADARWWIALPFAVLAARSWFLHNPSWRPARIGMIELACLVLVVLVAAVS